MISSKPILTSQGEGPIAGTIIMARYLDAEAIHSLSDTIQLPIVFSQFSDADIPADIQTAHVHLSNNESTIVQPIDSKTVAGYSLIDDINGKPISMLRIEMSRNIYIEGLYTLDYYTLFLILLSLLFILTIIVLVNRLIISRLKALSSTVNNIGSSKIFSGRIKIKGNDELSSLAKDINEMFNVIQLSQSSLQKKQLGEERLRLTMESVTEGINITNIDGKIIELNDAAAKMYGCRKFVETGAQRHS